MYLKLLNLLFEGKKYLASTPQTTRAGTQIGAHAHGKRTEKMKPIRDFCTPKFR